MTALPLQIAVAGPLCPYVIVDVFTNMALSGNQLAVFTDGRPLPPATMQRLARELNLAESVFLLPPRATGDLEIRIFTPVRELPFAGHPILGAAAVVAEAVGADAVRLETGAGAIAVEVEHGFARMDQPVPTAEPYERTPELLAALGLARAELPVESYRNGPLHAFVALESPGQVAALEPDLNALAAVPDLAVTCFAPAGGSWKTRTFAPAHGVAEDAATGSAAGALAIHLTRHGAIECGEEITIRQGAEIGRPSTLYARAQGTRNRIDRLHVGGAAVLVAGGHIRIPDKEETNR